MPQIPMNVLFCYSFTAQSIPSDLTKALHLPNIFSASELSNRLDDFYANKTIAFLIIDSKQPHKDF